MFSDPFVAEVVRIIKKCHPRRHGDKALILVSKRFYDAACEETLALEEKNFGSTNTKIAHLLVNQVIAVAVPWLSDYEFEIRKP